jgi:hypothetical protein
MIGDQLIIIYLHKAWARRRRDATAALWGKQHGKAKISDAPKKVLILLNREENVEYSNTLQIQLPRPEFSIASRDNRPKSFVTQTLYRHPPRAPAHKMTSLET